MAQVTFSDGIESLWGAIDQAKEGKKNGYRVVARRHNYGEKNIDQNGKRWHQLFLYHFHEGSWSEGATRNREMIKAAQRTAHDIERAILHPEQCSPEMVEEGIFWKAKYEEYCQSALYEDKPYHLYPFIYVTIYREMRELQ